MTRPIARPSKTKAKYNVKKLPPVKQRKVRPATPQESAQLAAQLNRKSRQTNPSKPTQKKYGQTNSGIKTKSIKPIRRRSR